METDQPNLCLGQNQYQTLWDLPNGKSDLTVLRATERSSHYLGPQAAGPVSNRHYFSSHYFTAFPKHS